MNRQWDDSTRGGGGTPYNGLYGEAPPERGTSLRLQIYERGGISLVEAYGRVETNVIFGSKKVQKGKQMKFMAVKKNEKTFWFCDLAIFKDSAFTAVKRDAKVLTRYVKGVRFFNIRYTKGVPFPSKLVKRG